MNESLSCSLDLDCGGQVGSEGVVALRGKGRLHFCGGVGVEGAVFRIVHIDAGNNRNWSVDSAAAAGLASGLSRVT